MAEQAPKSPPRQVPLLSDSEDFRAAGHALVDQIADFYASLRERPVTRAATPAELRALLPQGPLPETGRPAGQLLEDFAPLFFDRSLHNGHPRFFGYITSSAAPLGALADLLAASVNANMGRWDVAPLATEIEVQTVRWLAELVGYPADCGGLMVSGGNMANFLAFVAARRAQADWDLRQSGVQGDAPKLTAYVSAEAHTWVDKAADVTGLGARAIRWIATDHHHAMRVGALAEQIAADREAGLKPFLIVGTAGSTGTGAIDPLPELAAIAEGEDLWFHVDGAYGAPAAALAEAPAALHALHLADSVALDPHKWLYAPLEAACVLVRRPGALSDAFSFHPSYYKVNDQADAADTGINYYNFGMQNSRGFRALKVWLSLQHTGREGVVHSIREDMRLSRLLFEAAQAHPELEAGTQSLSITTFRYRPTGLPGDPAADYLNALNRQVLDQLQQSGEVFVSNASINGDFWLRACVVNFRSTEADVAAIPGIVVRLGREIHARLDAGGR